MVLRFRPLSPLNAVPATSCEKGSTGCYHLTLQETLSEKETLHLFNFCHPAFTKPYFVSVEKWQIIVSKNQNLLERKWNIVRVPPNSQKRLNNTSYLFLSQVLYVTCCTISKRIEMCLQISLALNTWIRVFSTPAGNLDEMLQKEKDDCKQCCHDMSPVLSQEEKLFILLKLF